MSDNIYRFESGSDDEESADGEIEIDEEGFTHIGYYVRRVGGELVLVQTFITGSDDPETANAQTVYFSTADLEPDWVTALIEQGEALSEGKSTEFIPPDDYDDFTDLDDELDNEDDGDWYDDDSDE